MIRRRCFRVDYYSNVRLLHLLITIYIRSSKSDHFVVKKIVAERSERKFLLTPMEKWIYLRDAAGATV